MNYFHIIFFILTSLLMTDSQFASAQDTYFRGFYHGSNIFVRNPYLEAEKQFCIQAIYLNGEKVADSPNISAYELSMKHMELESRVVIRIVHHASCSPELINPEVIQQDLAFSWMKLYVNEDQIIWITTKEDADSYYILQREAIGEWETLDTVQAKGNIFINQHSKELEHSRGENNYRLIYVNTEGKAVVSESFFYFSNKREVSHAVDVDRWVIEFTEEVDYQLLNDRGRIILRGRGVSLDIRKLPRSSYIIRYDGKETEFTKD